MSADIHAELDRLRDLVAGFGKAAKLCEQILLRDGDPFDGDDWQAMQDLRAVLKECGIAPEPRRHPCSHCGTPTVNPAAAGPCGSYYLCDECEVPTKKRGTSCPACSGYGDSTCQLCHGSGLA